MTDPADSPKAISIKLDSSFEDNAGFILKAFFPKKTAWDNNQAESMGGFMKELVAELWNPILPILRMAGIGDKGIEKMRLEIILVAWNQVCTDLFGSHIQVVAEKEN